MTAQLIVAAAALIATVWIGAWVLIDHVDERLARTPRPAADAVVIDQTGRVIDPVSHRRRGRWSR